MYTNKKYILLTVIFLLSTVSFSQYRRPPFLFKEGLSVSVKGGLNMFYGDLVDETRNSYSFGATLDREMNEFFTLRTQLMSGAMKGTQIEVIHAHHFENFYIDWTIGGTYNILNHTMGYFRERIFQPYAMLHVGLIYFNATEYWDKTGLTQYLGSDVWRKASGVAPLVGLGGGTTIWINPNLKATLEFHGNYVLSDKVDAHDVWWELNAPDRITKTSHNDFYYTATVGVAYLINDSRYRNDVKFNRKSYERLRKHYNRKNQKTQAYRR